MEWIKRNLVFVAVGAASLVLLGVATWFLFAQMGGNATADQTLTDLLDKRLQLWSAPVHPVGKGEIKNIDEVQKDRKRLEGFLTEIKAVIPVMPPVPNIDDQGFKGLLERTIFQLSRYATNSGIPVPDGFAFSFTPVRSMFRFNSNSISPLVLQLGDVQALTEILVESHVNSIDGIRRSPMTVEDQAATGGSDFLSLSAKTNEFTVSLTYELTFQGFSPEIAEIINRMMRSERCIIVKDIEVSPGGGMTSLGEGRPGNIMAEQRAGNPYAGLRPGGGRASFEQYQQIQPGVNPMQPTVVLDSRPLRITMLVDVVRLVGTKAR
jgi:hypothetical protein